MPKERGKEVLTTKDLMFMLDISRQSIYRLMKSGKLSAYKLSGRLYFKRSEVMAALEENKVDELEAA